MVETLGELVNSEDKDVRTTDIPSLARGNLSTLQTEIRAGISRQSDSMSKYHLEDLLQRINRVLNPK